MKWALLFLNLMILHIIQAQKTANALSFDGIDDYVKINHLAGVLTGLEDFTIEFTIETEELNQNSARVSLLSFNKPNSGDNEFLIVLGETFVAGDEKLNIYDQHNPLQKFVLQSPDNITGTCAHIAYVKKGNTGEAFVDGVSIGTHYIYYNITANHRVSIGQDWDNNSPSDFFKGNFSNLKIWNIAKTSSELKAEIGKILKGDEDHLINYYPFTQGKDEIDNSLENSLMDVVAPSEKGQLVNFSLLGPTSNWIYNNCTDTSNIHSSCANIKFPNLITPNSDWAPIPVLSGLAVTESKLVVYNRWGQPVYSSEEFLPTWEGYSNKQKKCANGVYFWVWAFIDYEGNKCRYNGFIESVE